MNLLALSSFFNSSKPTLEGEYNDSSPKTPPPTPAQLPPVSSKARHLLVVPLSRENLRFETGESEDVRLMLSMGVCICSVGAESKDESKDLSPTTLQRSSVLPAPPPPTVSASLSATIGSRESPSTPAANLSQWYDGPERPSDSRLAVGDDVMEA